MAGMRLWIISDNVFLPNERIFMNGKTEFSGMLVERFAYCHEQSYGGMRRREG